MSAIAGLFHRDHRPVDASIPDAMAEVLAHRGRDGAGVWRDGSIALVHRMLHTTPESLLEKLPQRKGPFVITADARIDNRDDLIAALQLGDRPASTITDSDLILAAYEQWGEACPTRLIGDFAFAIWDAHQHHLFCARDVFGVKPFYYFASDRTFVFASEIKALFCSSDVPRRLNEVKVGDYLEIMMEDQTITGYEGILRLPASCALTVRDRRVTIHPYWHFDPHAELRLKSSHEYAEAYRETFTEAVRCRLRSAFPIGSFLSGGLDSSSVTCVARDLLRQQGIAPLPTFSGLFETIAEADERPFIQAVLDQGGLDPHFIRADQLNPLTDSDRIFWHQDDLFHTPNLYMNWAIYGLAQPQGIRILLDGFVGDSTVFHGWEYLNDLSRSFRWIPLFREVRAIARRQNYYVHKLFFYFLWQYAVKSRLPKWLKEWWHNRHGRPTAPTLNPICNPQFAEAIGLGDRLHRFRPNPTESFKTARDYHHYQITTGEIPTALEVVDKCSQAFGIETRFPFTDRRLATLCLAMPPSQKLENGYSRMIVRRALDCLPDRVRWRDSKGNLYRNLRQGVLTHATPVLDQAILQQPGAIAPYVHLHTVQDAYQRLKDTHSESDFPAVWLSTHLSLWLHFTGLTATREPSTGFVSIPGGDVTFPSIE